MSDFVSFEIAKKLKEKGFRKPCILYYNSDKVRTWFNEPDIAKNFVPTTLGNDDVLAPTISQVLKWLREEKEFMVFPVYSTNTSRWYCSIVNADSLDTYKLSLSDSYEQATLAGIEYVLDNLI